MSEYEEVLQTRELVKRLYKDEEGKQIILTDGQCLLFNLIFKRKHKRVHLCAFTRYGKSLTIALAVLTRLAVFPEKWAIVAGNTEKAGIIISYIIQHIFDNPLTRNRFVLGKGETVEEIRRYRNKNKLNFKLEDGLLSEVFISTAAGALGFGAPNVIEDESALVDSKEHSLVVRMVGDQTDNFLCKIGNPWESEHFRASSEDPTYTKVIIDWRQGLREGRITQEKVDEARKLPFFGVLYDCVFPPRDTMSEQGWIPLLIKDDIDRAMIDNCQGFGVNKLGVDVAGGGRNFSVIVQRHSNYARKIIKSNDNDTMILAESIINQKKLLNVINENISVDNIGMGKSFCDFLDKMIIGIKRINAGEKPLGITDEERFVNIRAMLFWKAREWILAGGKLLRDDDWHQLTKIKYRTKLEGQRGKMQIMSKEDMFKEGVDSPDVADALAFTFINDDIPIVSFEDRSIFEEDKKFDHFGLFDEI